MLNTAISSSSNNINRVRSSLQNIPDSVRNGIERSTPIVRTQSRLLILKVIQSTIFLGNTVKREGYSFLVFVQRQTILVIGLLSNLLDLTYEVNSLVWLFLKTKFYQTYDGLVLFVNAISRYASLLENFLQNKSSEYALRTQSSFTRFCFDAVDIIKNDAENMHELVTQVVDSSSTVLLKVFGQIFLLAKFIGKVHVELYLVLHFLLKHQLPEDVEIFLEKMEPVFKTVNVYRTKIRHSKFYRTTRREVQKQVVKVQHLNYKSWVELSKMKISLLKQNAQRKMSMRDITLHISEIRFGVEHLELLKYTGQVGTKFSVFSVDTYQSTKNHSFNF